MQMLTGLDEMFLSFDTSVTTGHIGGIAVFNGDGTDRLAFARRRVAERLPTLPPLRWQLTQVGTDRYWAESEVDVDAHVLPATVAPPGGDLEFFGLLDHLMSPRLDRLTQMWQLYVIEGLADGRYAYLLKISHGLVDGRAMMAIIDLLSDDPEETPVVTPLKPESLDEIMSQANDVAASRPKRLAEMQLELVDWATERVREEGIGAIPATMARTIPGELGGPLVGVVNAFRAPGVPEIAPLMPTTFPPHSPFNGTVTPRVGMALADLSLEDLRKVGKLVGGSANDALLATCAGALRRYMDDHDVLIGRPLLASTPTSWQDDDDEESWENQVWMLYLNVPTQVADPLERLRAANHATTAARDNWRRLPGRVIRELGSPIPGALVGPMAEFISQVPAGLLPKAYNICLIKVRGPKARPAFDGAEMEKFFVYGFLPPTCGLLVAAASLAGRMTVTYTGCWDIVKDLPALSRLTYESLDELLALT